MKIEFNNNKCYFEGFKNEIDGVSYRSCPSLLANRIFERIAGAVFQSLGMIKVPVDGSQKVVYIRKQVLIDWINKHKQWASDSPIYQNNFVWGFHTNQMTVDDKLRHGQFEDAIDIICTDHAGNQKEQKRTEN